MKKYITGDLLHYKICNAKYLIEVTNTSKHGYCFKGVKDDFNGVICDEFIEDIPLTPEILEKNGWKTQNRWYYYLDVAEGFIPYIGIDFKHKSNKGHLYVEVDGNNMGEIQYCHELQHFLFCLGLKYEMEV